MVNNTQYKEMAYLAGPFFNAAQKEVIFEIEKIIKAVGLRCYSPMRDTGVFTPGSALEPSKIFKANVEHLQGVDLVVAVTDGKDVGTIFECGFAFALGVPIVYVWLSGKPEDKFNIMLAESGFAVARTLDELADCLRQGHHSGIFTSRVNPMEALRRHYEGEVE